MKNHLFLRFILLFVIIPLNLSAQKEFKQKWYLQFHSSIRSGYSSGIDLPHAEVDSMGNTFISFLSNSTFEFQSKIDTGYKSHLYKIDKNGELVWSKIFRDGFEVRGGGIGSLTSDRNGGVFVDISIGNYFKFSKDSTFVKLGLTESILHIKANGEIDRMTMLPIARVSCTPVFAFNGKIYYPRDRNTLYIISNDGKIENSYFPYYFDYSYHFAVNKSGQIASLKVLNPYESFKIGDSTYVQSKKKYGYVVVVREKTGALLWHKFFKDRNFLDLDDNHSLRWDNDNNLYCALNFGSSTDEYSQYIQDSTKSIIYKLDQQGNIKGSLFDTLRNSNNNYYTQVWLQNDGSGNVYADLYTASYAPMNYPKMNISSADISKYTRLLFDTNFNIKSYYQIRNAPRLDNSLNSYGSVFWKSSKITMEPNRTYELPNGETVNCTSDHDFFVIYMDTNKQVNSNEVKEIGQKIRALFTITPNPTNAKKTFKIEGNFAINKVIMYDLTGKIVHVVSNIKNNSVIINTNLLNGIYFVRTEFVNGERATQKIVISD